MIEQVKMQLGFARSSYVYFVRRACGSIKIGLTTSPEQRFSALRSRWGPLDVLLVIDGTRETESAWHREWRRDWLANEWFRSSPELRAAIDEVRRNWDRSARDGKRAMARIRVGNVSEGSRSGWEAAV